MSSVTRCFARPGWRATLPRWPHCRPTPRVQRSESHPRYGLRLPHSVVQHRRLLRLCRREPYHGRRRARGPYHRGRGTHLDGYPGSHFVPHLPLHGPRRGRRFGIRHRDYFPAFHRSRGRGGVTYYYQVTAVNRSGESARSAEINSTTGTASPAAPSGLAGTPGAAGQINLTWVDNSTNEDGFTLESSSDAGQNWQSVATTAAGAKSFTAGGLRALTNYQFRVRAFNAGGFSAYSNTVAVTSGLHNPRPSTTGAGLQRPVERWSSTVPPPSPAMRWN